MVLKLSKGDRFRPISLSAILLLIFAASILQVTSLKAWVTGWSIQIMDVEQGAALAYDFSAVYLGTNPSTQQPTYVGLFHAEPFNGADNAKPKWGRCHGDSTAARYANAPFGVNVFGTHTFNNDMLITQGNGASGPAEYLTSSQCSSGAYPYPASSGAANPTLIYSGGTSPWWILYYISGRAEQGGFRNYLMPAILDGGASLFNMFAAPMYYLNRSASAPAYCGNTGALCFPGDEWTALTPQGGNAALVYRDMLTARPAHQAPFAYSAAQRLQSSTGLGLMGSFTYNETNTRLFWYYVNQDPDGHYRLHRRIATNSAWVTQYGPEDEPLSPGGTPFSPTDLGSEENPLIRVNYHASAQTWVVLYSCYAAATSARGDVQDICMQTFPSADLTGFAWGKFDANPSPNLGIGIPRDPCVGCSEGADAFNNPNVNNNYWISQFNIRKDGYGHHFSDEHGQVIVYFSAQGRLPHSVDGDPYFQRVYGKQVNVQ